MEFHYQSKSLIPEKAGPGFPVYESAALPQSYLGFFLLVRLRDLSGVESVCVPSACDDSGGRAAGAFLLIYSAETVGDGGVTVVSR
jgi:hypothetical protein